MGLACFGMVVEQASGEQGEAGNVAAAAAAAGAEE